MALVAISCQSDFVDVPQVNLPNKEVEAQKFVRSYEDALKIAEEAVLMIDEIDTRSSQPRRIMRDNGQVVCKPVTRSGETSEEPIMYIFNNENNAGFTIVAADASHPSLIAVTESGNYTYGEPTGAEPFDLLMEDVVKSLIIVPDINLPTKTVKENQQHNPYGPLAHIQWGIGTIYGSLYPDGIAYDEAAAIAQCLIGYQRDITYTITNPNSNEYGLSFTINRRRLSAHFRYDHPIFQYTACGNDIHEEIARLYLEIGYRLSQNTAISLSNKTTSFLLSKVKSVLASFGISTSNTTSFLGDPILPRYLGTFITRKEDMFVFRGTVAGGESMPNGGVAHYWIASGFDEYTYDNVTYTLNKVLNPSHPFPNEYTETGREAVVDYMLYLNWGYDGISNGWFHSGCFDMSQRVDNHFEDSIVVGGTTPEYNYNFTNITFFSQLDPIITVQ